MGLLPWYMGLLAEQYGKIARTDRGLRTISDALAAVERTSERWCEAELYRHREVRPTSRLLARVAVGARQQHARGLELRAASSLTANREREQRGSQAPATSTTPTGRLR
jgi:hypothetical protein